MPRTLTVPSALLGLLIGTAAVSSAQRPDPPGKLVDAGEHKIHLFCQGAGTPAVILEPGIGWFSIDWALVQPSLAQKARVCSWDRAGSAWSDMTSHFGEFDADARDLATTLRNAGIAPPYVLVGDAFGTLSARNFQRLYPGEVAGLVLIDSLFEEEATRPAAENGSPVPLMDMSETNLRQSLEADAGAEFTPATRPAVESLKKLPTALQAAHAWAQDQWSATLAKLTRVQWAAILESARSTYIDLYKTRLGSEFPLGSLPLAVISPAGDRDIEKDAAFARLSSSGQQVLAKGTDYPTPLEQPDLVVGTVLKIVATAQAKASR